MSRALDRLTGHRVGRRDEVGAPLLKTIVGAGVPVPVLCTMVVVGMDLTVSDFRRIVRRAEIVMGAITGQLLVLPIIGWFLVGCLALQHVSRRR
jgi:predicted Na+-dependent transporter